MPSKLSRSTGPRQRAGVRIVQPLLPAIAFSFLAASANAAHPLFTDDTGTQGTGRFQLETVPESSTNEAEGVTERTTVTSVGLAYGLSDTVDAFVGVPYLSVDAGGERARGVGDSQAGIKWRFYESGPVSLALKPAISFPTGDEDRGLGSGRTGYSLFASGTYTTGHWTGNAQIGHIHAPDIFDSPPNSTALSIGGWYEIENVMRLVLDFGRITNPDSAVPDDFTFAIVGAIFMINDGLDVDIGYRKGMSEIETDYTLMLGVTTRY